jgi:arylsulfatase A-like enzyme
MRGANTLVLLLCSVLTAPAQAQEPNRPVMASNVILVGWDGAHRDHVKALLGEGKLPNLHRLIEHGKLVDIAVTSGATDTKAGWTQILTGYRPEVTGVYGNFRFRDVPAGYSLFERLRAEFGAQNIATVAVIGKEWHCGEVDPPFKIPYPPAQNGPKQDKPAEEEKHVRQSGSHGKQLPPHLIEDGGKLYLVFNGSPYYTMHKNVDQWHFGLMRDSRVGNKTLAMLDQYYTKPFFFFVHFAEVDHAGHKFGEWSKQYDAAIVSGDKQLGRIMDKLEELGVSEKTLIYVTADHGFDVGAKMHHHAPYVFLATNDQTVVRGGTRADIAPTILARLGVDLSKIAPPLDGEPLSRPAAHAVLKPSETNGSLNSALKPKPGAGPKRKHRDVSAK